MGLDLNRFICMIKSLKLYIIFFNIILISCNNKSSLYSNDYELFNDTQIEDLVEEINENNIQNFKNVIKSNKIDLNYKEPTYGNTLLMVLAQNNNYEFAKVLLEEGADPNIQNNYTGSSALIYAAIQEDKSGENLKFIKLLLNNKANPNLAEIGERNINNQTRKTPLLAACGTINNSKNTLEKVKLLVNFGANIDYTNEFNQFPIGEALIYEHYDVVLYLIKKGANTNKVIFDRSKYSSNGKKIYLKDLLNEKDIPVNSINYKYKLKILNYLKK